MQNNKERETFRKNLAYFVEKSGKQQQEIAAAIGVPATTFNSWVLGKSAPNVGKIQLLADYFNIGKSALIEEYESLDADSMYSEIVSNIGLTDENGRNMIINYYALSADDKKLVQTFVSRLGH